ncbi:MAG: formylglycine-generating enzyme family protein, partial [Clostridia bacterium]|nr:formylglycine-generating enzyme family protein [Clostridia bacterium]
NGAVKVARSMYKNDSVHKVTSTLCYGVQWDAALNFIDSNYISGSSTGYAKNSSGKGNYTNSIATTGSNTNYQQKHIYDMAGNIYEWTMEAYHTGNRVIRGGSYYIDGYINPASIRNSSDPSSSMSTVGFRPALYL